MAKVLVLYYSSYGHVETMANKVAEGARSVSGVEVTVKRVPETIDTERAKAAGIKLEQSAPVATPDELANYDAIIFGTPTRFGDMAAQMRTFLDQTGGLWMKGALVGKLGSVFTSTGTQHGGQEMTLKSFHTTLLHHGMSVVGVPYAAQGLVNMNEITGGTPYGASTLAGADGSRQPSQNELEIAHFQGKHVAELAVKFTAKPAQVATKEAAPAKAAAAATQPAAASTASNAASNPAPKAAPAPSPAPKVAPAPAASTRNPSYAPASSAVATGGGLRYLWQGSNKDGVLLASRVLLVVLFLLFGWQKLTGFSGTVGYMASTGLPAPTLAALLAVVMEFGVGVLIALGFFTRPLALLLAVYTVATAFIGHPYWTMTGMEQYGNMINFYKNVSIAGALLLLVAAGPGKFSLDRK